MLISPWAFYLLSHRIVKFVCLFTWWSVWVLIFLRTVFLLSFIVWRFCFWDCFRWVAFIICLFLIGLVMSFPHLPFEWLSFSIKSFPALFPESIWTDYRIALRVVSISVITQVFSTGFQIVSFQVMLWTWPIIYLFVASQFPYVDDRWFVVWVVFIVFWVSLGVYRFGFRVTSWFFWVCRFITRVSHWVVGTSFRICWRLRSGFCPYWGEITVMTILSFPTKRFSSVTSCWSSAVPSTLDLSPNNYW